MPPIHLNLCLHDVSWDIHEQNIALQIKKSSTSFNIDLGVGGNG